MVKMLVDTSVWLSLAQDPKDGALIAVIETLVAEKRLQLVVPAIVLKEFLANRSRVASDYAKRLGGQFRVVREAVSAVGGDTPEVSAVLKHLERVDRDGPIRAKMAAKTFERIEKLLKAFPAVESSESAKLRAMDRALADEAPFHQDKNSAADALIIETYAEELASSNGVRCIFVTHNTGGL